MKICSEGCFPPSKAIFKILFKPLLLVGQDSAFCFIFHINVSKILRLLKDKLRCTKHFKILFKSSNAKPEMVRNAPKTGAKGGLL